MLETEEVDVDYFTPASGTSLSKIFSNNVQKDEDNSSLKYTPPLPTQTKQKTEEKKPTQCVYATALFAYEWSKNTYVSKEKVGFAILKIVKTGLHNIVLYNSNKTTLSCLTITENTVINVKDNVSISYYDNHQKYWNLHTSPDSLNKILNELRAINVSLKDLPHTTDEVPAKDETDSSVQQVSVINRLPSTVHDKGSDTDSSVNRRTKDSILKRMATMGQSVLPPTHFNTEQTSDSSDTNETHTQHKTRHKPFKTSNKRNIEKNVESDDHEQIKNVICKPVLSPELHGLYPNSDQQIVAVKTIDMVRSPVSAFSEQKDNMTLFISEQRVNNSEMRININRITDKLNHVLDKIKDFENVDKSHPTSSDSQFCNDIIHKLLKEYEAKIKNYEVFIKSKGLQCDTFALMQQQGNLDVMNNATEKSNDKQCNCKELIERKEKEISDLKEQVISFSSKLEGASIVKSSENNLSREIDNLKTIINKQDNQISNLSERLECALSTADVANKLKKIMNDAFQNVSENFDDDTSYTGANIKSVVASVIKKTTMECLREFK